MLLQSGVKAGMTLYDIAILCCRNDDCGEVPSKLENLIAMSKELASAAVRNGRWHHAAASLALADQLSAENNRTLPSLFKSKSSVALISAPHMAQSSGSDSSSDCGDGDQEECEEWAAAVIAEARVAEGLSPLDTSYRQRAISFGNENSEMDDSSKSTDGGGFWHVAPCDDVDEDDQSWANSYTSPRLSPKNDSRPSVTFDVPTILLPPPSLDLPPLHIGGPPKGLGLQRSQSYSAFSFPSKEVSPPPTSVRQLSLYSSAPVDDDQYRAYLLKYVDLLIKSETISKSRSRQGSVTSDYNSYEGLGKVTAACGF